MFLRHSVHSFMVAELISKQNGTSSCRSEKRTAKLRLLTADLGNRNGPSPKINNLLKRTARMGNWTRATPILDVN